MPSLTMWSAVFQATVICILATIYVHYHEDGVYAGVLEDPTYKNWTSTLYNSTKEWEKHHDYVNSLSSNRSLGVNKTLTYPNGTFLNSTSPSEQESKEPFYTVKLPYDTIVHFLLTILQYQWYILMERLLPARPRRYVLPPGVEQEKFMSDAREEQIVNKWVAQGRVNRASLNWGNTFLKLILSMTVMRAACCAIEIMLPKALRLKPVKDITEDLFIETIMRVAASFFHIDTIAELIAFIVVPAHKQVVFVAGMAFAFEVFLMTVVRIAATWAVRTDWAQAMMRNGTENAIKSIRQLERQRELMKQEL